MKMVNSVALACSIAVVAGGAGCTLSERQRADLSRANMTNAQWNADWWRRIHEAPDRAVAECIAEGKGADQCNEAQCDHILHAPFEKTEHYDYGLAPWGHEVHLSARRVWFPVMRENIANKYCSAAGRPSVSTVRWQPVPGMGSMEYQPAYDGLFRYGQEHGL